MNNLMDITRRNVLKAAGAVTASATLLGAGTAYAAPRKGGTARFGIGDGSTSDTLDPAKTASTFSQLVVFGGLGNTLTSVAPNGDLVPDLAESWEDAGRAKQWVFRLVPGVEFHNGKSLTAQDVIATMDYHRREDSGSGARTIAQTIAHMKADDDQTIIFELVEPNADFPFLVNTYQLVIMPTDADGNVDPTSGIGTGSYRLGTFEAGQRARLERFENHHHADRGWFDAVELVLINDDAARQAAFLTGEVDIINRVPPDSVSRLSRSPKAQIVEVTGNQHFVFPMHVDTPPFNDPDVRLALKLAIDRQAIVDRVLMGHGAVANDHPIGPANTYFADDLEQRAYDPDEARHHLKKAGLENLTVDLSVSNAAFPGTVDTGVLYKEAAEKAGIEINLVREPSDGYWSNVWLKKPFCASYWGGRPTENWMFSTAYVAGAAWNETRWSNERFAELLQMGQTTTNPDDRRGIYREMQKIVRDDGGSLIFAYGNYIDAASDAVGVPESVSNQYELDGFRALDSWWFK